MKMDALKKKKDENGYKMSKWYEDQMRINKGVFTKVAIWLVCHRLSIKIFFFFFLWKDRKRRKNIRDPQ